jgi:glycosyltransferase involved in cell wall biosynthesis
MKTVTVVITSFNRLDLLKKTVASFEMFNTYPISQFIIIEDSCNKEMHEEMKRLWPNYTLIFNEKNLGLIDSIDKAYSLVTSDYIFHTEDDYEFYRSGFIERSLVIMDTFPKIMQVWIRNLNDIGILTYDPAPLKLSWGRGGLNSESVHYHMMGMSNDRNWYGFCFQCGLRRMDAYNLVKPYSKWSSPTDFITLRECKIGRAYWDLGYRAAILDEGYCRHLGMNRSTYGMHIH